MAVADCQSFFRCGHYGIVFQKEIRSGLPLAVDYQIAANGVAQSIWSMAALAGVAIGPAFITVIGQCMGNGDTDAVVPWGLRTGAGDKAACHLACADP